MASTALRGPHDGKGTGGGGSPGVAANVTVTPAGNIASTNVQAALQELDTEKAAASHTHAVGDITSLAEFIRDTIGATLVAGTNMTVTVNDAADTITLASSGVGGLDAEAVRDTIGAALVAGSNVTITVNDAGDTITIGLTGVETPSGAQSKVDLHVLDPTDAHDASAISFVPTGTIAATDVQAAIVEVMNEVTGASFSELPVVIGIRLTDNTTQITTGRKDSFRAPFAFTLSEVKASLYAAGAITVDIHGGNDVTILGNKLTVDAGEKTSETAATGATLARVDITEDEELFFDIDSVDVNARGVKIWLLGYRAYAAQATVPGTPTNLTGTVSNSQIALTWSAPSTGGSPITDYVVEYKLSSSGTWSTFADGTSTTTAAIVTGLLNGNNYDFRVAAVNSIGQSAYSATLTKLIAGVPAGPAQPTGTPGNGQVSLTWSAPADNGAPITDYVVQWKLATDPNADNWFTTFADGTGTATSATVTGLTNGVAYNFRVAGVNSIGTGFFSQITVNLTPVDGVPSQVGTVTTTPGAGQMGLSWSAPSNGGSAITDYVVQYALAGSGSWNTFADGTSTSTTATVTGLTGNTSYDFRVAAVNANGQGAYSATVTATTGATVPGQVGTVTPTAGNGQVVLAWSAPSNGGAAITDYVVQYKLSTEPTVWTTFSDGTSATTGATVTGLTNDLNYNFRVAAVNSVGTGPYSSTVSSIPTSGATVPSAPTLALTGGAEDEIYFTTTPGSNGGSAVTDWVIQYSVSGANSWTTVSDGTSATPPDGIFNFWWTPTLGTTYDVRVAAVNAIGQGSWSNVISRRMATTPGLPTGLTATPGNAQVALDWNDLAVNVLSGDGGSPITDWIVQYRLSPSGSWTTFSDGTSAVSAATVTGLTNGTAYDFRVRAVNAVGQSIYTSATATATPVGASLTAIGGSWYYAGKAQGTDALSSVVTLSDTGHAIQSGDILIAVLNSPFDANNYSSGGGLPTGFTKIPNSSSYENIKVGYRICDGSEPSTYSSFAHDGTNDARLYIFHYRGDGSVSLGASTATFTAAASAYTAPAVTAPASASLVVRVWSLEADTGVFFLFAAPGGMNNRQSLARLASPERRPFLLCDAYQAASGSTGTANASGTFTGEDAVAYTLVFSP